MENVKRLWNRNFVLLWQGQFISDFGNAAFAVALGFWVLDATRTAALPSGNMALMGIIEACFALPAVLLGPLAGAIADRHSRKWIIVAADFIRGVLFAGMGVLLLMGSFPFWVIYPLAVLAGACGSFFGPAISSAIPDIVDAENLTKANSARSFSSSFTQLAGNSLGGLLYSLLAAPAMILINGVSFIYAAVSQIFMKIPQVCAPAQRKHILADMADGLKYVVGNGGLRALIAMNVTIGFFSTIVITLLTPLFKTTPGFGVENYGYVMGTTMVGAILGMVVLSFIKIKPEWRARMFCFSQLAVGVAAVLMGLMRNVAWLFPLAFAVGAFNAVIGTMLSTVLQSAVPRENRGKTFGILGTLSSALQPLGMAMSGVIAQAVGVRPAFVGACCVILLASLPILFSGPFREFMNTDTAAPAENSDKDVGLDVPVESL